MFGRAGRPPSNEQRELATKKNGSWVSDRQAFARLCKAGVRTPLKPWGDDSMKKFLLIQRSQRGGERQPPSPAQMQAMFAVFNAWKEKFKDNILDLRGKLNSSGKVVSASGVTDGPFIESKEIVGGFMIIAAESYERALELAREGSGVMMPGSSVDIREITTS
jgi:hypothetical protein